MSGLPIQVSHLHHLGPETHCIAALFVLLQILTHFVHEIVPPGVLSSVPPILLCARTSFAQLHYHCE